MKRYAAHAATGQASADAAPRGAAACPLNAAGGLRRHARAGTESRQHWLTLKISLKEDFFFDIFKG